MSLLNKKRGRQKRILDDSGKRRIHKNQNAFYILWNGKANDEITDLYVIRLNVIKKYVFSTC